MFKKIQQNISSRLWNNFRRVTTSGQYLPEVDGIRFLSISWVVLMHISGYYIAKAPAVSMQQQQHFPIIEKILSNGGGGVSLFFVLSGFILALPFARYYLQNGNRVTLKNYYIRRLTRIEPPYMIAMLLCFAGYIFRNPQSIAIAARSLLASLLYVHNIFSTQLPALNSPAWSLELEVQFYIIAPLLFQVFRLPATGRKIVLVAAMLAIITIRHFYPHHFFSLYSCFEFFLAGLLLADIYVTDKDIQHPGPVWIILFLLCLVYILFQPLSFNYFLHYTTFPFVIILFFYIILRHKQVKALFSYKWIPVIGGMCYSIYLLHYPVISFVGSYTVGISTGFFLPDFLLQTLLSGSAILVICGLFYYYVERPFMRWGKKYKDPASS